MIWRKFQSPILVFNISLSMTFKTLTPKWQNSTENCLSEYLRCCVGLHTTLTHVDLHTTPMHKYVYLSSSQSRPLSVDFTIPNILAKHYQFVTIRKTFEQLDVQNMLN